MENNCDKQNFEYEMFLNMVGGHALIIKIGDGKILKSASKNEIQFYESELRKKIEIDDQSDMESIFPKYYGVIKRVDESHFNHNHKNGFHTHEIRNYKNILNYIYHIDYFFFTFLHNLQNENKELFDSLNIEKDEEFQDKLESFLSGEKKYDSNNDYFDEKLNEKLLMLDESKLKWILFWYIKWRDEFIKNDFVVLEDLTANMESPAIIDFKLGFHQKKRKKDFAIKQLPTSSKDLGFRIMGLQSYHASKKYVLFKNRYEGRKLTNEQLKTEIINFLTLDCVFLEKLEELLITKLKEFLEKIKRISFLDIPSSSLLLIYDSEYFSKNESFTNSTELEDKLKIKLIDFSYFTGDDKEKLIVIPEVHQQKNIIVAVENIIEFLTSLEMDYNN